MINELDVTTVESMQNASCKYLKKWAGLFKKSDKGILFRSKEAFGRGITSLKTHYKRMQIIKCYMLRHSKDEKIIKIYQCREEREGKMSKTWKASQDMDSIEKLVQHNLHFPGQTDRVGLGHKRFCRKVSNGEIRKLVTTEVLHAQDREWKSHATTLKLQGDWTNWTLNTCHTDLSWNSLCYQANTQVILLC